MHDQVFISSRQGVRILSVGGVSETSRRWLADSANRKCDAPGSWYCPGQYPPPVQVTEWAFPVRNDTHTIITIYMFCMGSV